MRVTTSGPRRKLGASSYSLTRLSLSLSLSLSDGINIAERGLIIALLIFIVLVVLVLFVLPGGHHPVRSGEKVGVSEQQRASAGGSCLD
jgi:hypothetical protein